MLSEKSISENFSDKPGKTDRENADSDSKGKKDKKDKKDKKSKQGIAGLGAEGAKNLVINEIKHSDDEGLKAAAAVVTAGKVLSSGVNAAHKPNKQSKITKGDFRRSSKKSESAAKTTDVFSSAVLASGKGFTTAAVTRTGAIAKGALTEGKAAVKNSILNAVEENSENSLALSAADLGIKTADTVKTTAKGTKAVINTGKTAVKAAASAPKSIYSGTKRLKEVSKRLYKFARMERSRQIQIVGKGLVNVGKAAVSAVLNIFSVIAAAVSSFFLPFIIIALVLFAIISSVVALIPLISLKADDETLTEVWEYISEKDADLEIEYKDTYNDFPQNNQHYMFIQVYKYFAVNGSEVLSSERGSSSDISTTSYKTNIDAFLAYLDAKYEDYEFADIQNEIDDFYDDIVSVQYVSNEENPSIRYVNETSYRVFMLNVNLHYSEVRTYIQNNKDTIMTEQQAQIYDVLDEVGQYLTRIELDTPIETEDSSIACKKRYGYYVDTSTNEKKFHSGIDIVASPGTNVLSPLNGKVSDIDGDKVEISGTSGKKYVTISNVSGITVSEGDVIEKGTVLGTVDNNGYICIEYKIRRLLSDTYLNPSFYLDNIVYINSANTSVIYDSEINLSNYRLSTELTGTAQAVVEAALAMIGESGYSGRCATVASTIYQTAGLGYHGGNGNDFSRANKLSVSDGHVDYTKIPVGAYIGVKYGTGSAGFTYGHVGIYVGIVDGTPSVVEGGGTLVRITSLDHFYEYYVTNNANSTYGNDIGWNITSTNGSVSPLYFEL